MENIESKLVTGLDSILSEAILNESELHILLIRLDILQAECIRLQLSGIQLEVLRRTAETRLLIACKMSDDASVIRLLFTLLNIYGYSIIDIRIEYTILVAETFARLGDSKSASELIDDLKHAISTDTQLSDDKKNSILNSL